VAGVEHRAAVSKRLAARACTPYLSSEPSGKPIRNNSHMAKTTPHDALIHIMVTMSAADRSMTDAELGKIGTIINTLPVFKGYTPDMMMAAAHICTEVLQAEDGLNQVLDSARASLPRHMYETAYALAVEVAAADLRVEQEELRLLQIISEHFNLDKLVCAAIERGARARHQTP
jgi:tellurite resistance protein